MEEYRFLMMRKAKAVRCAALPTFTRLEAESRMDAIEKFAQQYGLTIRQIATETVSFHPSGTADRQEHVFYSVSGHDPWLKLLMG